MNLYQELDRLTAPPACASRVRDLSRDEIEALQAMGKITAVEQIPFQHRVWVDCCPHRKNSSTYGRSFTSCKRFFL